MARDHALPHKARTEGDELYDENPHPYLDEPLAQLVERIPELETLQPAPDQQHRTARVASVAIQEFDTIRSQDSV